MIAAEMLFTMGLPAAGKSTIVAERFSSHEVIDSDAIMATHPEYDPKNPQALYPWARSQAEQRFAEAVKVAAGLWVVDSTGTDIERTRGQIEAARRAGFSVRLVYVVCRIETSIARNQSRTRTVPEHVIRTKAEVIAKAFETIAQHADDVQVIDND